MNTRPKPEHADEPFRRVAPMLAFQDGMACPRERFFVEARKRDDGDVEPIVEER